MTCGRRGMGWTGRMGARGGPLDRGGEAWRWSRRPGGAGTAGRTVFELASGAWDEIQPGSYIFMDADYARNEWAAPLPAFLLAFSACVRAVANTRPGQWFATYGAAFPVNVPFIIPQLPLCNLA